jgi:hypothetical protein
MVNKENPETPPHEYGRGSLGTLLLAVGAIVVLLATVDSLGGLPFDMPRSWYLNRGLWVGIGVACLVAGVLVQRPPKGDERDTT